MKTIPITLALLLLVSTAEARIFGRLRSGSCGTSCSTNGTNGCQISPTVPSTAIQPQIPLTAPVPLPQTGQTHDEPIFVADVDNIPVMAPDEMPGTFRVRGRYVTVPQFRQPAGLASR